jgi:hypothetical protein
LFLAHKQKLELNEKKQSLLDINNNPSFMRKNGICCTQTKKLELDKENQCYLRTSKRAQAQIEQYFLQIQTELELYEKKQVFLTLKQKIELNEEKKAVFLVQTNKNLSFTRKKKAAFLVQTDRNLSFIIWGKTSFLVHRQKLQVNEKKYLS